jgi:GAF domain-containing protein
MCGAGDMEVVAGRLRGAVTHGPGSGLGIVQWDGVESATELVRRADEALYADKARGSAARLADPVRLAALDATGLLDAPSQPELDEISRMVSWLLDVPVATVSLVDDHRQFFAGACGLAGTTLADRQTPLSTSFCQHAVSAGRPLIVRDAREVPLLRDNPAIEERGVIAYAGIPLIDASDNVLGVLCAIDHEPRDWSDDDIATLRRLARCAIGELVQAAAPPV